MAPNVPQDTSALRHPGVKQVSTLSQHLQARAGPKVFVQLSVELSTYSIVQWKLTAIRGTTPAYSSHLKGIATIKKKIQKCT